MSSRATSVGRFVAAVGTMLLVACDGGSDDVANTGGTGTATSDTAAVATAVDPACPTADFEAFLRVFAEDPEVQERWTEIPLPQLVIDNTGSEPRPAERTLQRGEAVFPIFPPASERVADSREIRIQADSDGRMRVAVEMPNTDWKVDYVFAFDTCWRLVRIEDWSL